MNKSQKQVTQTQLNREKETIKELKRVYQQALADCEDKIRELSERTDMENLQSIIYQKQYQEALKAQLEGVLSNLQSNSYATVSDYLTKCYRDGYTGVMYDLQKTGIPIIMPIDQAAVVRAIQTDSKLSKTLYDKLGEDVTSLKKAVRTEVSRGIANGSTWNEVAGKLARNMANTPFQKAYNNSIRIARTEGHRIQVQSALDAQYIAKSKGADIVKQWDSSLDGRTRPHHRQLDGQLRELDELFEVDNLKAEAPGMFGDPAEDCNCRCCLLQRARWALDDEELETLRKRAEYFGLDKTKDFEEYQTKYFKVSFEIEYEKDVANTQNGDSIRDIMFKASKSDAGIIRDEKAVVDAYSQLPDKVQKAMADVTFNMGQNGSSCDVKKGIINVAKGAEKEDIDHEFGHLIEERMLDPKVVEKYKKYLTEGLSDADITSEIYENDSGEKFNIYILHGDKFISEYQGRLYIDDITEAITPDGNLDTEFMWEAISELFRVYQNDKTLLNECEIKLIEEALR